MKNFKIILVVAVSILTIIIVNIFKNNKILNTIYISYGNTDKKCKVESITLDEDSIIEKYNTYDYVKLDKIVDLKSISYKDLQEIISYTDKNQFKYGISLFNNKVILLSEEINSNKIINYEKNSINFNNLNQYLEEKNINYRFDKISSLVIFSTESKLLHNDDFINLNSINGYNLRNIEINKNDLNNIINNTADVLVSMNSESGKYIYGRRTYSGKSIDNYNILRHAGSTWSLILYYKQKPSSDLKYTIDNSINYLLDNYIINYDDNTSFVLEKKSNEIKLGGNALTLLMLSEYYEVFNDNKYEDISRKIANGIIYMQEDNGEFYHILDTNGQFKEKYRTVFYDGEAVFSLLKFYKISNNPLYYECAKKSIDMFLENDYEKYRDHWISYSMNEFIRYNLEEKYIEFALNNYIYNINKFDYNESFGPTRLELLLSVYDSYNYILLNKPDSKFIKNFKLDKLKNSIEINLEVLFNYYINDEIAMYFDKPYLVVNGFHDIDSNFRMRIDDIQHSMIGLINYYNHFNF